MSTFSKALRELKNGNKVKRAGWEGHLAIHNPTDRTKMTKPYIYREINDVRTPFVPSNDQLLAEDWETINATSARD